MLKIIKQSYVFFFACACISCTTDTRKNSNNPIGKVVYQTYEKSISYSKEKTSKSRKLGFSPSAKLIGKNGNIYLTIKFCNYGGSVIKFRNDDFDENSVLGYKVEFYFNGRELAGKTIVADTFSNDVEVRVSKKTIIPMNKCREINYNITDFFRVYNLKGQFSIFYRDEIVLGYLDNDGEEKWDSFFVQSNTAKLLVK